MSWLSKSVNALLNALGLIDDDPVLELELPAQEIVEDFMSSVRINPVILRPRTLGNDTDKWRVVAGDDWIAFMNGQADYMAFVECASEADAKAFKENVIRGQQS